MAERAGYRGRIAPSPTGYLHLGHARTFWIAAERARAAGGTLVFRNEDLDRQRVRPEFVSAMYEDLRWLGIEWQEGPDVSLNGAGPFGPYCQSERREVYLAAWRKLRDGGAIYPCTCSRKDLAQAAGATHEDDADEVVYPGTCRENRWNATDFENPGTPTTEARGHGDEEREELETQSAQSRSERSQSVSWRFRVPEGEVIRFDDAVAGPREIVAGRGVGDFLGWRRADVPDYRLACVDDHGAAALCGRREEAASQRQRARPHRFWRHRMADGRGDGRGHASRDGTGRRRSGRVQGDGEHHGALAGRPTAGCP